MEEQTTKPSSNPITWVVLVIVVLALLIGGYFLFFQEEATNTNTVVVANTTVNENTNTLANTNTEIDTSEWLTYTNTKYNFSLKYPQDWGRISEFDGSLIKNIKTFDIQQTNSFVLGSGSNASDHIVIHVRENYNIDEFIKNDTYETSEGKKQYIFDSVLFTTKSGINGKKVEIDSTATGYNYAYLFQKGESLIKFEIKEGNTLGIEIIKSMKYID